MKKKSLWAIIWESLTKTGGCCGSGESCCGTENIEKKEKKLKEKSD